MKRKHLIIITILVSLIFLLISNYNYIFADSLSSKIWGDSDSISAAGNSIVGAVQWIGIAVIVGATIYKGIKFVTSSPDGKAEIKKEIIMLVIGAILVLAVGEIIKLILDLVQQANLR